MWASETCRKEQLRTNEKGKEGTPYNAGTDRRFARKRVESYPVNATKKEMVENIIVAVVAAVISTLTLWALVSLRKWVQAKCKSGWSKYQSWRNSRKPVPVLRLTPKDGEKTPTYTELKEKAERLDEIRRTSFR